MKLTIDRMEIDDVGANPKRLADAITKQLPEGVRPIPVREIAYAIDIYEIREEVLDGLEGGLIVPENKSEGAILVHAKSSETRKRYTIAHEIGHYVNPTHRTNSKEGFRCTSKDMREDSARVGDRHVKMEMEANQFAAELLMPEMMMKKFMRRKRGADIDHILEMATQFEVSKEAAARRYIAQLDEPAAVVFSRAGKIRYIKTNDNFPRLSLWSGDFIPKECISSTSSATIGRVTNVVETLGHLWLERSAGISLGEQTLAQNSDFRMTLLTVEEDTEDEDVWEPPKFKR